MHSRYRFFKKGLHGIKCIRCWCYFKLTYIHIDRDDGLDIKMRNMERFGMCLVD